jgi:PKD repeat protein
VTFTNKTAGGTSWKWEFTNGVEADRIVSSEQNPTITFYKPGTWTVTLTASGLGGTTAVSAPIIIDVAAGATAGQGASQGFNMPARARSPVEPDCALEAAPGIVLGDDVLGTPDPGLKGTAVAFSTTASQCGRVGALSVYLDTKSTATKLVVGLYSDQGGHPGTLLAQGTVSNPVAGAWNTVAIPPKPVVKDTVYWIAILGGPGGTVYYHTRAGACAAETSAQTGLAALPSAWFTGSILGACPVAAYGTATP